MSTYANLAKQAKARLRHMKKRKRAEDDLDLVCQLMGHTKLVSSTTTSDLETLVSALEQRKGTKGKSLSGASINRYLASLSGAFKWVVSRPELGYGTLPLITWPWQPEKPPSKPVITQDLEQKLIGHLMEHRPDVGLAFVVMLQTGMRVGEYVKITHSDLWGDVWITLRDTKNGDDRDVDVSPEVWGALQAALASGRLPPYHVIRDVFLRARKALGLDPRMVIHCCRHTVATRLADAETPDTVAMRLLGHRAVATYQRYAHKSHKQTQNATRNLRTNRYIINTTPKTTNVSNDLVAPVGLEPTLERF